MKHKGAKLTGSSLLTILGVVCFAAVLVAAAAIAANIATSPKNVVTAPLTLTSVSGTDGGLTQWTGTGDAIAGQNYTTGLQVTEPSSSWVGNYKINFTISAATGIAGSDVKATYKIPSGSAVLITAWNSTTVGGQNAIVFSLPTQASTGSSYNVAYDFTIIVNSAFNSVVLGYSAHTV